MKYLLLIKQIFNKYLLKVFKAGILMLSERIVLHKVTVRYLLIVVWSMIK